MGSNIYLLKMYNDELKTQLTQDFNKISLSPFAKTNNYTGRILQCPPKIKLVTDRYQHINQGQLLQSTQPKRVVINQPSQIDGQQTSARLNNESFRNCQIIRLKNHHQKEIRPYIQDNSSVVYQKIPLHKISSNVEAGSHQPLSFVSRTFSAENAHMLPKSMNLITAESIVNESIVQEMKDSIVIQKMPRTHNADYENKMKNIFNFMKQQIRISNLMYQKKAQAMIKEHAQKIRQLNDLLHKNSQELKAKQMLIHSLTESFNKKFQKLQRNQKINSPTDHKITFNSRQFVVQKIKDLEIKLSVLVNEQESISKRTNLKLETIQKNVIKYFALKVNSMRQACLELFAKYQLAIPTLINKIAEIEKRALLKVNESSIDLRHLKEEVKTFFAKQFKYEHQQVSKIHSKIIQLQESVRNIQSNHHQHQQQSSNTAKKLLNFQQSNTSKAYSLIKLEDYSLIKLEDYHFSQANNRSNYVQDLQDQFFYPGQIPPILDAKTKKFDNDEYEQFISDCSDEQDSSHPHRPEGSSHPHRPEGNSHPNRSKYLIGGNSPEKQNNSKMSYNQIKVLQTIGSCRSDSNNKQMLDPVDVKYDKRGYIMIPVFNQKSRGLNEVVLPLNHEERNSLERKGFINIVACL